MNQTIIPGTFYELDNEQKRAIRRGIELGNQIKEDFPEIANDYRAGKSLSEIVKNFHIKEVYYVREKVATEAVRYALSGYSGEINLFPEPKYAGLIEYSEFRRLAELHHREQGRRLGLEQGHNSWMKTLKNGTGVHALEYIKKHDAGQKGIFEQGHTPWSDKEILKLEELSQNPMYQRRTRIHAQNIAKEINRIFHNRKPIRDNTSVKKAFNRYKDRFEEFKQR